MSELSGTCASRDETRKQLLLTVSAFAFLNMATIPAKAEDSDRPTVWIELGSQLERIEGKPQPFLPPFTPPVVEAGFISPAGVEAPPAYGFGGEGKLTFVPGGSNWTFAASVRYGRSNSSKHSHQQTTGDAVPQFLGTFPVGTKYPPAVRFEDVTANTKQTYMVSDFRAGRDVGIGSVGFSGESTVGVGLRLAQFTSKANGTIHADPDFFLPTNLFAPVSRHLYGASFDRESSFRGVGPSVDWDASARIAGNAEAMELAFDLGLNGAILFGRQKMREQHKTSGLYNKKIQIPIYAYPPVTYHNSPAPHSRSRSLVVPNVGGFAGLSILYAAAKVSFGYRADFFFGAMDGGIDTRKTHDRSFYGPFATISIGLP